MREGASILVIGNEILSGKIRDSNSPWLISELRALGYPVNRVMVLSDSVEDIAAEVGRAAAESEQVFTSGGVGPTLDDLTFEGIARAFDLELVEHPDLARIIREHYGKGTTPSHLKMARIPRGARLSWSEGLPWPLVEVGNVFILPGDPTILRRKFEAVKERFRRTPWTLVRVYTLLEEGDLAPLLEDLQRGHPQVAVGSYPVYDERDYKVQVTLESTDETSVQRAAAALSESLPPESVVRID